MYKYISEAIGDDEAGEIKVKAENINMVLKDSDIKRFMSDYNVDVRLKQNYRKLAKKMLRKLVDVSSLGGVDPMTLKEKLKDGKNMAKTTKWNMKLKDVGGLKRHEVADKFRSIVEEYKAEALSDFGKSIKGIVESKMEEEKQDCTIIFAIDSSFSKRDDIDMHMDKLAAMLVEEGVCSDIVESKLME